MKTAGPFQFYEEHADPATCAPRLTALRKELKKMGLDGFIVPREDEYQGEYVPKCSERLSWLTSFTGSAGAAIVFLEKAFIFIDGRYTLQVQKQTDTKLFEPRNIKEGIKQVLKGGRIGYDPWLHTQAAIENLRDSESTLVPCETNPIDAIWSERPEPPSSMAIIYPNNYAGETAESKRKRIAEEIKSQGANAAVITLSDSICWLLNIRGMDVPHTPFVLCFAILHSDTSVDLFIDPNKLSSELVKHLGQDVRLHHSNEFAATLRALLAKKVLVDPVRTASAVFDHLKKGGAIIQRTIDPIQLPKACKNSVEIEGFKKAHLRDGAAVTNFLCWLAREAPKGKLTEIDVVKTLEKFRMDTKELRDISFDTIAGAGPHAAIVHYRVTESSNRPIKMNEMLLIDSGAQYLDGTTDITRTVIIGQPANEMRDRFTRVLKGHIGLATARFPEGITGARLDPFARKPLWDVGLDYDHGSGHGVGAYLSVHEGPQGFSAKYTSQPLMEGMVCSNEPGYYKEGEYGIRIENMMVVVRNKNVLEFEILTLAPIDRNLIDVQLLTPQEIQWINDYHARVREKLISLVLPETRQWLEEATQKIVFME